MYLKYDIRRSKENIHITNVKHLILVFLVNEIHLLHYKNDS